MRGVSKIIVQVDLKENEYVTTESGLKLFQPPKEGDKSLSMPNYGKVIACPEKVDLLGKTVYMNYRACGTFTLLENVPVYIVDEQLIVAHSDMKAYKSVLIEPIYDEFKSDVLQVVNNKRRDFTRGVVLDSDVPFCKSGDEIEFEKHTAWDYLYNHKPHYYIQWVDRIVKVNGELVNGWNELAERPERIEQNGILVKNRTQHRLVSKGEYAGRNVYIKGKILADKYARDFFAENTCVE